MYDLLKINDVEFPEPAGFDVSLKDKTNVFNAENGIRTVEVIREGIVNISVTYNNITDETLKKLKGAITKISTVEYYDPYKNIISLKKMEVSGIATKKKYHRNGISTWSLTFKLEEI